MGGNGTNIRLTFGPTAGTDHALCHGTVSFDSTTIATEPGTPVMSSSVVVSLRVCFHGNKA